MVKVVIFDMDGVIMDSETMVFGLMSKLLKKYNINFTRKVFNTTIGMSGKSFFKFIKEKYNLPEPYTFYGSQYSVDEEIAAYKHMKPLDGVMEFIQDLLKNNIKTALATSASKRRMCAAIDEFKLHGLFEATISADDITESKPDPTIFLTAANQLGVSTADCVVIEDAPNGIKAAKAAGMKCIAITTTLSEDKLQDADLIINNFDEINHKTIENI